GMLTVLLGAVLNIALDPLFIFTFDRGVRGAALGRSKQAIFFSLLRKVVIVIPLTLILPQIPGVGVHGVFLAEAISNFLGGGACFITMLCTIWRELKQKEKTAQAR
ncbi:MAG: hypothetical protein ACLS68_11865, partial [Acutalibacteraceae bacterium]